MGIFRVLPVMAVGVAGVAVLLFSSGARVLPSAEPSPYMSPPPTYPSPVLTGPGAQAVNCAAIPHATTGMTPTDSPGDLVGPGVVAVTRCDTPLTTPPPTTNPPQVLTRDVRSFVQLLNTLPAVDANQSCFHIAFPTQLAFVFSFDPILRQRPQVVLIDRGCSALVTTTADGITTRARSYAQLDPMPLFEELVAAQPRPDTS